MTTITTNKKPFIPDGWMIESHTPAGAFDLDNVQLHLEPEQEKSYLKGTILRERLKDKTCLDASVLDYLLEHTDLIPETWKGKYVYFWGTIYRHSVGGLYVRCLCWRDGEWYWSNLWLGYYWRSGDPAAVLASTSSLDPQTSLDTVTLSALAERVKKLEDWKEKVVTAFKQ